VSVAGGGTIEGFGWEVNVAGGGTVKGCGWEVNVAGGGIVKGFGWEVNVAGGGTVKGFGWEVNVAGGGTVKGFGWEVNVAGGGGDVKACGFESTGANGDFDKDCALGIPSTARTGGGKLSVHDPKLGWLGLVESGIFRPNNGKDLSGNAPVYTECGRTEA